jgi:tetratricopeptide (TPR) repeat protein
MQQKRWLEAEALLRRGSAVENVISYQSLGILHYTLGKYDQALRETDRAIEIARRKTWDPAATAELHFNKGAILWALGQSGPAAGEWRAALLLNPRHAQAREWLRIASPAPAPPGR